MLTNTVDELKKGDAELAAPASDYVPAVNRRRDSRLAKSLIWALLTLLGLGAMFALGIAASVCERSLRAEKDLAVLDSADLGEGPQLDARGAHDDDEDVFVVMKSPAPGLASDVPMSAVVAVSSDDEGFMIPISTQTELSTIYSMSRIPKPTPVPTTEEEATSTSVADDTSCIISVVTTKTQVAVVTVSVIPTTSDTWSGYVTITGDASTVTQVEADTSYTSGLPDVTVWNNPSTLTQLQTDLSFTSGLPDATVSGNPATVTDVQTRLSVTSGPPDVTISGDPSTVTNVDATYSLTSSSAGLGNTKLTVVISDLWQTLTQSTVTTVITRTRTATTTEPSMPYSAPTGVESSSGTLYLSNVDGATGSDRHETISSTASITATIFLTEPPYPSNGTVPTYPYGTVTSVVAPTTPVVISGANVWAGPWGPLSAHMCAMVMIAVIMSFF